MKRYLTWWAVQLLCGLAGLLLMPLALALVWLARLVASAQDRTHMELLRASAAIKNSR